MWNIFPLPGLNDTANPPDRLCTIEDLCGHGGFHDKEPNQWWRWAYNDSGVRLMTIARRFITPIFLHAGFLHIGLNMLAQLTAGAEVSIVAHALGLVDHPYVIRFRLKEIWVPVASSSCILLREFSGKSNHWPTVQVLTCVSATF